MSNPWINHVKAVQAQNNCSYKDAMKLSKQSYSGSGTGASKGMTVVHPQKKRVTFESDQNISDEISRITNILDNHMAHLTTEQLHKLQTRLSDLRKKQKKLDYQYDY